MKYLRAFRGLVQKTRIFRRYVLNVRKLPVRLPTFVSTMTEAKNDTINRYGTEFAIKTKSYDLSEYHRALYTMVRILKPEIVIEAGVFEGHSSLSILSTLKENKGFFILYRSAITLSTSG